MKLGATGVHLLPLLLFERQNWRGASRQTPYFCPCGDKSKQKRLSPCGGHLLCQISWTSTNDFAQEAGPLQGGLSFL
jgi:hypothetical protein